MAEGNNEALQAALLERAMRERASRQSAEPERTFGQAVFENVIGSGEIDTPGERLGAAIQDVLGAGAAGVGRGVTTLADLPQQAVSAGGGLLATGLEKAAGAAGIEAPELFEAARQSVGQVLPGGSREAASELTGGASEFRGETLPGEFAGTVGEFVPGALLGGGPAALGRFAVLPGMASEAAGQLTEGTAAEPFARAAAAIAAPSAVSAGRALAQRAVSPGGGAPQAGLDAARVLEREGVRVTAGQATGNEAQLFREAATTAGRQMVDDQAGQFTKAVLKRIGASAERASPEVLTSASRRIGDVFEDVAKGVDIPPTSTILGRSSQILQEYNQLAPRTAQAPIIGDIHKKITRAFRGGNDLTSAQVLNWRSALSKLTRTGDAATRGAAVEMVSTLDDALGQSLTALGRADDIQRLSQARSQWGNLIAIENAVTRAGEAAATGIITPANLRNALAAQGRRAFAQGRGDLNELARAGVTVIKPLPQSGTQPRTLAREITSGAQGGTAAGLGSFALGADPVTAATIGAGAVIAPRIRNAFLASPAGQAFMRNQLMQSTPQAPNLSARGGALASGLLSGN